MEEALTVKEEAIEIPIKTEKILPSPSKPPNSQSPLWSWCYHHPLSLANLLFFININILLYLIGLIQSLHWLIDLYWTIIPVLLSHYYATHPTLIKGSNDENLGRSWVVLCLTWLWSVRLTHSYFRREGWEWGVREDWRFSQMRKEYGKHWWWISFFAVYVSQQDVAVKVFSKQEYSDDVILTFRKEYLVDAGLYETNEETSKREEVLCQIDQVDAKRVVTFGILSLSDPRSHIIFHLFYVVGDKVAHSPIGDWILLLVHNTVVAIWWASHHIPSLVTQNLNTHIPGIYTDLVRTLLSVNAIEDRFCCHYNHKKLVQPTETEGWAIVNFSVRGDIKKIWTDLARCGQQNGIYIEDPCAVFGEDAQARQAPPLVRVEQMLEKIKSKLTHLPRFLLCLLSEKKTSTIHVPWKRMTIADLGIVTHCISPLRVNDQYLTNVILEMNAKVGGLNSMLAMEQSPCIPFIVADFSRMEVLPPSPPLPLNSKHHAKLKLVPRARPGFARRGQPITLLANHFKVTVGSVDDDFYQYIVALSSDDGSPVDGKGIGRKVIDKLQETYDTELAGKDFAYDGEDILFTVGGPLPQNKLQFTVILEDLS